MFKISRVGTIAGCYVTQGMIERSAKVRVIRGGVVVYPPAERTAGLESLKRLQGRRPRGPRGLRVRPEDRRLRRHQGRRRDRGVPDRAGAADALTFSDASQKRESLARFCEASRTEESIMKRHRLERVAEVVREVAASTILFDLRDPRVKMRDRDPGRGVRRPAARQGLRVGHGVGAGSSSWPCTACNTRPGSSRRSWPTGCRRGSPRSSRSCWTRA